MNRIIHIEETDSTNSELLSRLGRQHRGEPDPSDLRWEDGDMLVCYRQRAGRGQQGNRWEAEPGLNIALSLLLCPDCLPARESFLLSEAFSLAVCRCLESEHLPGLCIKWPNDIYVGDRKLGGILIENTLGGDRLLEAVCGLGLNVNQRVFRSDAPNPVSLCQLTGRHYDLPSLTRNLHRCFLEQYDRLAGSASSALQDEYRQRLYRREGWHPYRDAQGLFEGRIVGIGRDGRLHLQRRDRSQVQEYAFKEVAFVL